MKIQSLAIIFIIIIMPITIVLSEYVNNKITTATTELEYNTRLLNSTYDSIKAYQLNTVNNSFGDVTNSKISDLESAVNTFYNSLSNNFNYTGYKSEVMKEYIPAIAFTLYDGYYIYSPFMNTLTNVKDEDVDTTFSKKDEITDGLKPYVYYSARYVDDSKGWDFIITYTLDNYITIQGQIGLNNYVYDSGYLYSIATSKNGEGIYFNSLDNSYYFDGIQFTESDTEELKEYIGDKVYSYAKINGKKYYLDNSERELENINYNGKTIQINTKAKIFFIDDKGAKNYNQVGNYNDANQVEKDNFIKYYLAITQNKSSYIYYKRAYEFSYAVLNNTNLKNNLGIEYKDKAGNIQTKGYGLSGLDANQFINYDNNDAKTNELKKSGITPLSEYGNFKIFDGNIHLSSSNFNKHRKAIIRYIIETNLSTAIAGFSSSAKTDFIMPKISETDWEIIQNDVCEITFLQGLNMGSKKYNGYSVVANTLTKEYVDENDIYILKNDGTYCKANDNSLNNSNIQPKSTYYGGIWKLNFERKKDVSTENEIFYYPLGNYLGSYTSIMGSSGITEIGTTEYPDIYTYMRKNANRNLKEAYYKALGRERQCSFNINNINYELYGSNGNEIFLQDY